ncbi:hypothetical protein D3C75_791540 [compost metagenome]
MQQCPAVLVEVEHPLGQGVTLVSFHRCLHHPDPVLLVTLHVTIEVVLTDQLLIAVRLIDQFVRVVRNNHFLFADQLVVVAIERTGVHIDLVNVVEAVGASNRVVVGEGGGTPHAALAREVDPGILRLIQLCMHQVHLARPGRG